jgi:hypothetical protein
VKKLRLHLSHFHHSDGGCVPVVDEVDGELVVYGVRMGVRDLRSVPALITIETGRNYLASARWKGEI